MSTKKPMSGVYLRLESMEAREVPTLLTVMVTTPTMYNTGSVTIAAVVNPTDPAETTPQPPSTGGGTVSNPTPQPNPTPPPTPPLIVIRL